MLSRPSLSAVFCLEKPRGSRRNGKELVIVLCLTYQWPILHSAEGEYKGEERDPQG